ncbi:hypothetical protein KUTeg_012681 [Tegillarca granosa]|uniref:Uncharacterized protein n=1 Tax=Tegillarca granosa TaxID=220873 RepID=A0ABQ9F2P7_TEGGR|nr:hypothetical protein KUTeg_012681 [Tegillarca granosa]
MLIMILRYSFRHEFLEGVVAHRVDTMLSLSETEYLDKIWTNPKHPAAFAGPEKLPLKGMAPADVNKTNEDEVRLNAYLRIVLSSTDSTHIYPDNKCYDFRVYLPKQLALSGNSTISLLEFAYQGIKTSKPELFIYCNLCDDTIVGERELPLLRRIYLKSSDNYIYDQPYEVPLKTVVFQDIQINIKDSNHELASFLQGEVTLTLQLKERLF